MAFQTTLSTILLRQSDYSQFCVFMIFGEQDGAGEEHIWGALRREVKVEQKEASSLHQFLVLRGPGTSFFSIRGQVSPSLIFPILNL